MSIHFVSFHYSAAENRKNSLKTLYFWVEGHSRLLMLIALKSTLSVHVMISSTSVPKLICKRFHTRQANSAKITMFKGCPSLTFSCANLINAEDWDLDR